MKGFLRRQPTPEQRQFRSAVKDLARGFREGTYRNPEAINGNKTLVPGHILMVESVPQKPGKLFATAPKGATLGIHAYRRGQWKKISATVYLDPTHQPRKIKWRR